MNIMEVAPEQMNDAYALLKASHLPTDDISGYTTLYSLRENEDMLALVGLEVYEGSGLLRSLCVSPLARNNGIGSSLVGFVETEASNKGLKEIYLLTETATLLFQKLGYEVVK